MEAAAVRLYCARVMHFSAFHLYCISGYKICGYIIVIVATYSLYSDRL